MKQREESFEYVIGDRRLTFVTQPGVFSYGELDEGAHCLLDAVVSHVKPHQKILDLGTGAGVIGVVLAGLVPRGEVWMVDVDIRAVRLAERNIASNALENARVQLSDITLDLPPKLRFDLVVSNPPTHSGKEVLRDFVMEAEHILKPGGATFMVANRLLSLRAMMQEVFGNVSEVSRCGGFLVFRSEKARRDRR